MSDSRVRSVCTTGTGAAVWGGLARAATARSPCSISCAAVAVVVVSAAVAVVAAVGGGPAAAAPEEGSSKQSSCEDQARRQATCTAW
jgi:hypothetical protein